MSDHLQDEHWRLRAKCIDTDPELFFNTTVGVIAEAKSMCAACPVSTQCLTAALEEEDGLPWAHRHGVRGGLIPKERSRLARKQAVA